MKCKICKKNIKSKKHFSLHLNRHKISLLDYYIKYENFKIPKCTICNKNAKYKSGLKFRLTCCSERCISELIKQRIISEETREKSRKARFEYMRKRTGKTAFEKKNKNIPSYLEEKFMKFIEENKLNEIFDIIYNYPIYPYFADFCFLNIRLIVELDGSQHFINGDKRIQHDIKRDKYLIEKGWNIFRIKYNEFDIRTQNLLVSLFNKKKINKKNYDEKTYFYKDIKKIKTRTRREYFDDVIENTKNKYKKLIEENEIDFSSRYWKRQSSEIFNCSQTHSRRIIKKYFPNIWKTCYKCIEL